MAGRRVGAGGVAAIHAARAKKATAELKLIEAALDKAAVGDAPTLSGRVDLALAELRAAKQKLEDVEWETA